MRYLVTGAAGFIGSYVSRALILRGDDVVGIDNFYPYYPRECKEFNLDLIFLAAGLDARYCPSSEVKPVYDKLAKYYKISGLKVGAFSFQEGDIRESPFLEKIFSENKFDGVVHLAAMAGVPLSQKEPELYTAVNVCGTVKLLAQSVKSNVKRFLFASSSSVYGNQSNGPVSENADVTKPKSVYGASKVAGELYCHVESVTSELAVTVIRIFGPVYGPLQRPYGMFQQRAINYLHNNKTLTIYGRDGLDTAKDSTYIDDEVDGIILALDEPCEKEKYNVYNISSGEALPLWRWIQEIERVYGGKLKTEIVSTDESDAVANADIAKAKRTLGFRQKILMAEGVRRQVEIFKMMPEWYKNLEV